MRESGWSDGVRARSISGSGSGWSNGVRTRSGSDSIRSGSISSVVRVRNGSGSGWNDMLRARSGSGSSWRSESGSERGRRAVRAGEVVLRSTPFAHAIEATYLAMYCDTCIGNHKDLVLRPCQECRVVWYCSEECKEEAQAWHRPECLALKKRQYTLPQDFVRLLARVVLRLRNGGDKVVEKISEREGRRFRDLMSHYPDIKRNEELLKDANNLRKELGKFIGESLLPNETDFLGIYGRIMVNRFSLFDKTLMNVGSAVYLAASIFDHECLPNCHISFSGRNVEIRALKDMPNFDYLKCRIAYVDPVKTVATRRQDLYNKWLFWCECTTCHDVERRRFENSVICENSACGAPVSLVDIDTETPPLQKAKKKVVAANGTETEEDKDRQSSPTDQNKTHTDLSLLQQKAKQQDNEGRNAKEDKGKRKEKETLALQESKTQNGTSLLRENVARNEKEDKGKRKESETSVDNATKEAFQNHKREDERKNGTSEEEEEDDDEEEEEGEETEEVKDGECVMCGRAVSEERRRTYWDVVAFTREKLRGMTEEDPDIQVCLEMMERQQGIFSHLNAWRVRTLDFAFNAAMFKGCWSLALKYAEENQDGMRFYYGAKNPVYGIFLYKFGKGKIYFKEFREGVRILDEAEAILTVALDDSHPLMKDLRLVNLSANEDVEICLERRIAAAKKKEEERKKREEEFGVLLPNGDNSALHKTFPWICSENERHTKFITPISNGIK